jgi:hypothetical protein
MTVNYDATLRPKFKQNLPKKIVLSKRIHVSKRYECQVTFWVPDTPYSPYPPGIGMNIRHGKGDGKDSVRLIFSNVDDLKNFLGILNMFTLDNLSKVGGALDEAVREWQVGRTKRDEAIEKRGRKEDFS